MENTIFFFVIAAKESKMFRNFPDDVLYALATEPLTSNFHVWSLSMQVFDLFIFCIQTLFLLFLKLEINKQITPFPSSPSPYHRISPIMKSFVISIMF